MDKTPHHKLDGRWLALALAVALLHGLLYVILLPPWQHYDEPNHFQRAALIARLGHDPTQNERLPELDRQIYISMVEHGFFDYTGSRPPIPKPGDDVTVPGYPQSSEPSLYYRWAALPVKLLQSRSIETQVWGARLASLTLFLLTVVCAWGAAREVFPPGHAARRLTPLALALLPGAAELMTAINNDALAIAVFSLFAWGSLRLLRRGMEWQTLLWTLSAALLTLLAKNTAVPALALLPLVWLLALAGRRRPWLTLAVLVIVAAVGSVFAVQADDARAWLRSLPDASPGRTLRAEAPLGSGVLALQPRNSRIGRPPFYQVIPPDVAQPLFGQKVTLGFWMWSEQALSVSSPSLRTTQAVFSQTLQLTSAPQFFAFTAQLPQDRDRMWVWLDLRSDQPVDAPVFLDGLVLVRGEFPTGEAPVWQDAQAQRGVWGGQPVENLLRNPAAETRALRLFPWLDGKLAGVLPDNALPSQLLQTLQDWPGTGYYLVSVARHLFETFWGRFAWGHIPLRGSWPYPLLAAASVLALLGSLVGWFGKRRESGVMDLWGLNATLMQAAFILVTLAGLWGLAWIRGATYLHVPRYYWPTARHALPSLVLLVLGLSFGWSELWGLASRGRRAWQIVGLAIYLALSLLLISWSVYSIGGYYGYW